jgi:multiple sugar transport system permease protein
MNKSSLTMPLSTAQQPTRDTYRRRRVWIKLSQNILGYILLVCLGIVFLIPFFWSLSSSLKNDTEIFVFPPVWIPTNALWRNYPEALAYMNFGHLLRNTLLVALLNTIGTIFSSAFVAYGFSRFRFKGSNLLFGVLLATMMLPFQVTMIPLFLLFQRIGWLNTYYPLVVPAFFANPFFVFLLRQFFLTLPRELDDAARVDGANPLQIWWRIMLPLAYPALATVTVFSFLGSWNEFIMPLIYLTDQKLYTLSLGLSVFKSSFTTRWGYLMAASVTMTLPPLLLFFATQRFFVRGIALTGIKG